MKFSNFFKQQTQLVEEGGNAVAPVSPILSEYQHPTFEVLEKEILQGMLGLSKGDYKELGSTFKKKPGQSSGDMDVAIDVNKVYAALGTDSENFWTVLGEKLDEKFPGNLNKVMKGLGVASIAFPIYNEDGVKTDENVQVDLMPTEDTSFSEFIFHSPDFTKDESKYKGLYRTELLKSIAAAVHIEDASKTGSILTDIFPEWEDEYADSVSDKFDQEFEGKWTGEDKQVVRYLLDPTQGLKKSIKTHVSPKTGKRTKGLAKVADSLISNDPERIIHYLLGDKYTVSNAGTFEDIYNIMQEDTFAHKEHYDEIMDYFIDLLNSKKLPIPEELNS